MLGFDKDQLLLLFSRMTWPSLVVRERACTSLAELMIEPKISGDVLVQLKSWINAQELESLAVYGLLILMRAKSLDNLYELPAMHEMHNAINSHSILSYLVLRDMYGDGVPSPQLDKICSDSKPKGFVPSKFFNKYCTNFLPPYHRDELKSIDHRKGTKLYDHWAMEAEEIVIKSNQLLSPEPLYFRGLEDGMNYGPVDFKVSEIYRSAYLRTLAWAAKVKHLNINEATCLAIKVLPIDPSLWTVKSHLKPQWWPGSKPKSHLIDTVISDVWQDVRKVWDKNICSDWLVSQASGRICSEESTCDLEIRGIFQRYKGGRTPDFERVFNSAYKQAAYIPRSIGLDGYLGHEACEEYVEDVDEILSNVVY